MCDNCQDVGLENRSIQEKYLRYYREPNTATFVFYAHADEDERDKALTALERLGVKPDQIAVDVLCGCSRCTRTFADPIMERLEAMFEAAA